MDARGGYNLADALRADAPETKRRTTRRQRYPWFGAVLARLGSPSCCSGEYTRRWRMDTGPERGASGPPVFLLMESRAAACRALFVDE
jgi:hypothetical protein